MATDSFRAAAVREAGLSWAKAPSVAQKTEEAPAVPVKATAKPKDDSSAAKTIARKESAGVDSAAVRKGWLRKEEKIAASLLGASQGAPSGSKTTPTNGNMTPDNTGYRAPVVAVVPACTSGKRKDEEGNE